MSTQPAKVEMEWESSGFPCVVVLTPMGHRCGYVGVPYHHPLWGKDYSESVRIKKKAVKKLTCEKVSSIALLCTDMVAVKAGIISIDCLFDVHGGITYAGKQGRWDKVSPDDSYWFFGFDCAHAGDAPEPGYSSYPSFDGEIRTLEFCVGECETLAESLKSVTKILKRDSRR